jgi:hypothetical protein
LRDFAPVLSFSVVAEGDVQRTDLPEMGERIEALAGKVESLRRFL